MRLTDTLAAAVVGLSRHRFRSLLATLGIVFGVAAVEAMVSISEGARKARPQARRSVWSSRGLKRSASRGEKMVPIVSR